MDIIRVRADADMIPTTQKARKFIITIIICSPILLKFWNVMEKFFLTKPTKWQEGELYRTKMWMRYQTDTCRQFCLPMLMMTKNRSTEITEQKILIRSRTRKSG